MKICAATGNAGKLRELRRILEAQGHEVVSQKELGITIEPDETGTTFEANALIKAETICKASGLPTIADDSGLCVDALDGAPGVYSARYCGHHGDDEANNDKLLAAMQAVPAGQRGANDVKGGYFGVNDDRGIIGKVYASATEEAVFQYYVKSDNLVDFEPLSLKRIRSISTIRTAVNVVGGSLQDATEMKVTKRGQAIQREQSGQKYWEILYPAEVKL